MYFLIFYFITHYFLKVVQVAHKAKEIVICSHKSIKEEEARHISAVRAFKLAKKKSKELNTKLAKVERDKKSVEATLNGAERQAKVQCKQLCQTEDELSIAKGQIKVLMKILEEAEKAKEQAEQDGYDVGVAEIKEAFMAEVSEV